MFSPGKIALVVFSLFSAHAGAGECPPGFICSELPMVEVSDVGFEVDLAKSHCIWMYNASPAFHSDRTQHMVTIGYLVTGKDPKRFTGENFPSFFSEVADQPPLRAGWRRDYDGPGPASERETFDGNNYVLRSSVPSRSTEVWVRVTPNLQNADAMSYETQPKTGADREIKVRCEQAGIS